MQYAGWTEYGGATPFRGCVPNICRFTTESQISKRVSIWAALFLVCMTFAGMAALPWILTIWRLKLTHLLYCSCVRTKSVVEQLLAYQLVLPSVPPTRTNVN